MRKSRIISLIFGITATLIYLSLQLLPPNHEPYSFYSPYIFSPIWYELWFWDNIFLSASLIALMYEKSRGTFIGAIIGFMWGLLYIVLTPFGYITDKLYNYPILYLEYLHSVVEFTLIGIILIWLPESILGLLYTFLWRLGLWRLGLLLLTLFSPFLMMILVLIGSGIGYSISYLHRRWETLEKGGV